MGARSSWLRFSSRKHFGDFAGVRYFMDNSTQEGGSNKTSQLIGRCDRFFLQVVLRVIMRGVDKLKRWGNVPHLLNRIVSDRVGVDVLMAGDRSDQNEFYNLV